jgi:hypothetical protein
MEYMILDFVFCVNALLNEETDRPNLPVSYRNYDFSGMTRKSGLCIIFPRYCSGIGQNKT